MRERVGFVTVLVLLVIIGAVTETLARTSHENLAQVLRLHVVENGPWKKEDVQVRVLSYAPKSLVPTAEKVRVLHPIEGGRPGVQTFVIAIDREGKQEEKIWVRAEIRIFDEVVVSSKQLLPNEAVTSKEVRIERRDISMLNGKPFYQLTDVIGKQVTRAIRVNEILTHRVLALPQLLRRGNPVMLVYESAGLRVEAPGIAEENGRAGEIIQVRNPSSGKLLRGKVLDQRSVGIH